MPQTTPAHRTRSRTGHPERHSAAKVLTCRVPGNGSANGMSVKAAHQRERVGTARYGPPMSYIAQAATQPESLLGYWWLRGLAAATLALALLSGPITRRRFRQNNLEKLLELVDKLPDSPARKELDRQVQRRASWLAAAYRVPVPWSEFLSTLPLGFGVAVIGASSFVQGHNVAEGATRWESALITFVGLRLIWVVITTSFDIARERQRFIAAGCPAYWPTVERNLLREALGQLPLTAREKKQRASHKTDRRSKRREPFQRLVTYLSHRWRAARPLRPADRGTTRG